MNMGRTLRPAGRSTDATAPSSGLTSTTTRLLAWRSSCCTAVTTYESRAAPEFSGVTMTQAESRFCKPPTVSTSMCTFPLKGSRLSSVRACAARGTEPKKRRTGPPSRCARTCATELSTSQSGEKALSPKPKARGSSDDLRWICVREWPRSRAASVATAAWREMSTTDRGSAGSSRPSSAPGDGGLLASPPPGSEPDFEEARTGVSPCGREDWSGSLQRPEKSTVAKRAIWTTPNISREP
mmetsp:Transcript_29699/g.79767  ORF Transcript_29699/g.79767 Transcript_29699/m.79767 type:complete len:240 (-) Transcript_29699:144-863(-)